MKTLLVSIDSKFIHSNLALKYIRNYCGDRFDIKLKEFTINQKIEYITDEIISQGADLICFSCYIWNIEYINEIIYILKTANPKLKILLGGPEVSYETKETMEENEFVDYIIYGEGEISFHEFLCAIHENKELSSINGLAFRCENEIIINKSREINHDLDKLVSPYENNEKYYDKIIYYESSRGCPYRCAFCMSSIDKSVRFFSLERVKSDLLVLLSTNARQIKFVDRTFNADYKRAMKIMQFIVDNNKNNMTIHFEITADIINDEFLDFLKSMPVNMFQFEIGIQSLNVQTLNEINRKTDIDKLIYVINEIKENKNMHMHLDLIAGLPYEDYNTFKTSFNEIHNLYADKLQLGFLKVLKGTKIYNDLEVHDIKYNKKAPYEIIKNKYISYEQILKLKNIEELVDRYYNEKYFDTTIRYVVENYYDNKPFDFYEDFSGYWKNNNLYMAMHNRKKLYEIIYNFAKDKEILSDKLMDNLLYDFVSCNEKEELISIFDKNLEENLRDVKRTIAKDEWFRKEYFNIDDTNVCKTNTVKINAHKIINDFRLVNISGDIILFIYKSKDNIFERCKTYKINNLINKIYDREGVN
ncbi:MAG TPA: B12-binding domain-containing radical SAM protein [Clostridiales bacterium]|nr:B12-binding domain-containing radical SAM protein [Clostridiales bacterium]